MTTGLDYICNQLFYNLKISQWYVLNARGSDMRNFCPLMNSSGDLEAMIDLRYSQWQLFDTVYRKLVDALPCDTSTLIHDYLFYGEFDRLIDKYRKIAHKMERRRHKLSRRIVYKRVLKFACHKTIGKILFAILNQPVVNKVVEYNLEMIDEQPWNMTLNRMILILRLLKEAG